MREILFRGKRVGNGKWVYGYYSGPVGSYLVHEIHNINDPTGRMIDVDPDTIGQYTGLTDGNGKKIFEGDILRQLYHPDRDVIIEWDDGRFNFRKRIYPKDYGYECLCVVQEIVRHLKVIGNIHDNPELLGGTENVSHP